MNPAVLGKWQAIRLIDIFILGPFLMYLAATAGCLAPWAQAALYFFGFTTIVVNMYFYVKILLWKH